MTNPKPQALLDDIEARIAQLACDAIVDGRGSIAAAAGALAEHVESVGLADFAEILRSIGESASGEAGEEISRRWQRWRADDEAQADAEALRSDADLAGMFVAEALDHLGTIEATLLKLEETPDDLTLLNDAFRPFHTIKGNAGALGVSTVQQFAHTVESLLDRCRSGQHRVGPAEIDAVLKSVDLLTALINDVADRAAGNPGRPLRADRLALTAIVERVIAEGGRAAAPARGQTIDLDTPAAGPAPGPATPAAAPAAASRDAQAVKVDTRKLDGLVDAVGELVIVQSLIYEDPALARVTDERLTRNLAQLRRITTDLQRGAMAMRMVPIRQTFQRMTRLVRDLSRRAGKAVELVLVGEDTELDRKVVEDINDPLMHMVRNSVDHGLETAAVRAEAGKRDTGRLVLRAFHQGGNIVIEVSDDGAGLDTERIRAKAIAQGLIAPDAALADEAIHELIFQPGFSTAEQITEISGRGVGMDVVRRNIDALRGRIEIRSRRGEGTTMSIKLPLTLAILDGLLIGVGGERFVMPTFAVRESLRPAPSQVHCVSGEPRMVEVRGRLLPLAWLSDLFSIDTSRVEPSSGTILVIEDETSAIGLVVDRLIGKQEVVVKSLGDAFAGIRGLAGGAILGDGRIGLILDAHGLVRLLGGEHVRDAA
ncbi:MAG: chemotaxis protein CheA [Acidobacteria bacterium]|nr:chemotaxis protein CheA [Acidobacteriota bacterium]